MADSKVVHACPACSCRVPLSALRPETVVDDEQLFLLCMCPDCGELFTRECEVLQPPELKAGE